MFLPSFIHLILTRYNLRPRKLLSDAETFVVKFNIIFSHLLSTVLFVLRRRHLEWLPLLVCVLTFHIDEVAAEPRGLSIKELWEFEPQLRRHFFPTFDKSQCDKRYSSFTNVLTVYMEKQLVVSKYMYFYGVIVWESHEAHRQATVIWMETNN